MFYLQILHWVAGFIVLAEALNKLERSCPMARGLDARARIVMLLKTTAWLLLALGAGIAVLAPLLSPLSMTGSHYYLPLLHMERPTLGDAAVMLGFAVLIVRTRVKEG